MFEISCQIERFAVAGEFRIARGAVSSVAVVVATLRQGDAVGRGECRPYARYGESPEGVVAAIEAVAPVLARDGHAALAAAMPAGAARNALDCAFLDLAAKRGGTPVHRLLGRATPGPVTTALTLSLEAPATMAERAAAATAYPLLKLKLGAAGDVARMAAVRRARPDARLIADANEGWDEATLEALLEAAAAARFELVEQPLPAGKDGLLAKIRRAVAVCADEFVHGVAGMAALADRYDAVNIKLDKTGGLTAALDATAQARRLGLRVMVGCMVASSLAMAPALIAAQEADWVDLDGPLLLAADRTPGLSYDGARIAPAPGSLWG